MEHNETDFKYKCKRCDYTTNKKSSIILHFNRKNICKAKNINLENITYKQLLDELNGIIKKYKCKYCDNEYQYTSGLYRHQKQCSNKEEKIDESKINIINNGVINININQVNILSFDEVKGHNTKFNINYINNNKILQIGKQDNNYINAYHEVKYFNDDYPQNKCIQISKRDYYQGIVKINSNNEWIPISMKNVFYQTIPESIRYCIDLLYNPYICDKNLTKKEYKEFKKSFEKFENMITKEQIIEFLTKKKEGKEIYRNLVLKLLHLFNSILE